MKKTTSLLGSMLIGVAAMAVSTHPPGASFQSAFGSPQSAFGPQSVITSQRQNAKKMLVGDIMENHADGENPAHIKRRPNVGLKTPSNISGADLSTWMGQADTDPAGYYSFGPDGSYDLLWSNELSQYGFNLTNAWMRQDRLCGLAVYNMGGLILGYNYVELDPSTGRPLKEESIGPDNTID